MAEEAHQMELRGRLNSLRPAGRAPGVRSTIQTVNFEHARGGKLKEIYQNVV
jgi:hypothetical protein